MKPDDAFLHWFAGFLDGEGCFYLTRYSKRGAHSCRLSVTLRRDDLPVLEEIQQRLGMGWIALRPAARRSQPRAVWMVGTLADCSRLVTILDSHPLRAKKARDYAVWRTAVEEWVRVSPKRKGVTADWSRMAQLKEELAQGRAYDAEDVEPATVSAPQLRLVS